MIVYSTDSRGAVVGDNEETVRHYVHRDSVVNALKWITNDANASGSAQLQTGITVHEQDATDLLKLIDAAYREARARRMQVQS